MKTTKRYYLKTYMLASAVRNQLRNDTIVEVNIESCHTSMA